VGKELASNVLDDGVSVPKSDGAPVGLSVGSELGPSVGSSDGPTVGSSRVALGNGDEEGSF